MALTTLQASIVNKSGPIEDEYDLGSRMRFFDTDGAYGATDGGYFIQQVTTAGTSNTTAATATAFHGPHGIVYQTGSGYYTLAQPVAGCHLLWFHGGATSQFIRSMQAGTGATGPSFHYGTGTTYAVIETTKVAGMSLDFYGLSSEVWLVGAHTSDDALLGLATSSG